MQSLVSMVRPLRISGFFGRSRESYHDTLAASGITNMSYCISPGTAHEWQTWRHSLHQFAPMLFKN
jgi:S-formylglutathione hydrolase FrmB